MKPVIPSRRARFKDHSCEIQERRNSGSARSPLGPGSTVAPGPSGNLTRRSSVWSARRASQAVDTKKGRMQ